MSDFLDRLAKEAALVTLTVKGWGGTRTDRDISEEVTASKHASAGWARVNKHLIHPDRLAPVKAAGKAVYTVYTRETMPWADGQRLLVARVRPRFEIEMEQAREDYLMAVEDLIQSRPQWLGEARQFGGEMFDAQEIPDAGALREKFRASWIFSPVPRTSEISRMAKAWGEEVRAETEAHMTGLATNSLRVMAEEALHLTQTLVDHAAGGRISPKTMAAAKRLGEKVSELNWAADPTISEIGLHLLRLPNDAKVANAQPVGEISSAVLDRAKAFLASNPQYSA